MALDTPLRGGTAPAAASDTTVLTQTTGLNAAVFVTITNRVAGTISVRLAIRPAGSTSLTAAMYRLYDFPLPGNESLVRGPFSLKPSDLIVGRSASTGTTFAYDGWEGI
jgi:hypothetical protein